MFSNNNEDWRIIAPCPWALPMELVVIYHKLQAITAIRGVETKDTLTIAALELSSSAESCTKCNK